MPRGRILKPDFFGDVKMRKLSAFGRLFYQGLWCWALCDNGHLKDDPEQLVADILPSDDVDGQVLLDELVAATRVIRRYMPDGSTYLHVWKLIEHAKVDPRYKPRCRYCAYEAQLSPAELARSQAGSAAPAGTQSGPPEPAGTRMGPTEPERAHPGSPELAGPRPGPAEPAETRVGPRGPDRARANPPQIGKERNREEEHPPVAALREQPQTARRRAHEEPPPDAGPPGTAEQLLAEWKGLQRRPVGSVVKAVGMWIHGVLGEGHDPDDIRETLRRWDAKDGKGPGLLPSMLNEVVNGPRARPGTALAVVNGGRSSRPGRSTTDERVAGWLALRSGT